MFVYLQDLHQTAVAGELTANTLASKDHAGDSLSQKLSKLVCLLTVSSKLGSSVVYWKILLVHTV